MTELKRDRSAEEFWLTLTEGAGRLGFDPAAAIPIEEIGDERFRAWLELGYDGEMGYLAKYEEQRVDPKSHFSPFRTVVSFLVPYDATPPRDSKDIGNIARYALGDDYHEVIKRKLWSLIDELAEFDPTLQARAVVDTAPILEKVAAERAGLGWQGKHSNLIREDRGSWFFLAELLISRDLGALPPAGRPAKDRCGTCEACRDACPTGAIVAPYVLDASRCISYLTIELRGSIPRELRPFIGHRIFGCDDCQEVCPWNDRAKPEPLSEFRARPGLRDRTLVDWLAMDLETWRLTFRRSAVKRTKYEGFRRNVAVALGCAADPETIPAILAARRDASGLLREHLAWALGRIPGERARRELEAWSESETETEVLNEIRLSLAEND